VCDGVNIASGRGNSEKSGMVDDVPHGGGIWGRACPLPIYEGPGVSPPENF